MSQPKNETAVLVLALFLTLGLVGAGIWWFSQLSGSKNTTQNQNGVTGLTNQSIPDRISLGERSLFPGASLAKQQSIEAISQGDYGKASLNLQTSLQSQKNDPEALIYLNNARIGTNKSYTIAASVPISSDPNGALEMLRGIAQAQEQINSGSGINGVNLKVAIASDDNNPQVAGQVASALVIGPSILGVVGPYASDVTLAAGSVYNSGQLVAISPISTSVKLSGFSRYVLRTVPSDYVAARALANYMTTKLQKTNAAVFFNSQSGYSQSLKSEFVTAVSLSGGQVEGEYDLSDPGFSAARSVKEASDRGVQVLMLATNTGELDQALQVVQVNNKRLKILAGDDVYTPKTLEVGGQAASGMVVAVPWHIGANSSSQFVRQSRQLWVGDVSWRTALAYDATVALIAAISQNPTRVGVQQALLSPKFSPPGAAGNVRFLPSGDRNAPVQLVQIFPGKRSGAGYDFVPLP